MKQSNEWTIDNRPVRVTRKAIKNIYLRVYSSDGSVRVSAPRSMSDDSIAAFVRKHSEWIDQRLKQPDQKIRLEPDYCSGSTFPLWGNAVELIVCEKGGGGQRTRSEWVSRNGDGEAGRLVLTVQIGSNISQRAKAVETFYRKRIKAAIPGLIQKYEPIMGVTVTEFGVKKMKTRWGTCNTRVGRIWLNLELVKKDPVFLEYVVIHEMVHLLEPTHNYRFKSLMDRFCPSWRELRKALNQS